MPALPLMPTASPDKRPKKMNILVTGAKGFVGRNLCAALNCVKDGKDRSRHGLSAEMIGEVMEYDIDTDPARLDEFCAKADFVFNLAGVNRPKDPAEFMQGNFGFASRLLDTLKAHGNACPVMISSSIQATLEGRYVPVDDRVGCCGCSADIATAEGAVDFCGYHFAYIVP